MSTSLLDWILSLLRDPDARAAFQADPDGYAADHGFQNLSTADVHDALSLLADGDYRFHGHHYPAPEHWEHHNHESGAHYLRSYIHEHHESFEGHDTDIDNSVHQDVDTHGGDFHQVIDNDPVVASGDHAVAAGGDIRDSTITSGDGNVVGDHNHAVTGDHNTTAFGSGDATNAHLDHTSVGDGGAISLGGDAHGHSTDNDTTTSVHSSGSGETSVNAAGDHGAAHQYADQHESDSSTHSAYEDDSHTDSHDHVGSHNDVSYDDSHHYDLHH